jgi:hypothetical protein
MEQFYGAEYEVLRKVKNRCGWISLHGLADLGAI